MQSKWWGWGDLDKQFPLEDRPAAWPYLKLKLGIVEDSSRLPARLEEIQLPACRLSGTAIAAVAEAVGDVNCSTQGKDRLEHAYGKSYKDLIRLRSGQIDNAPDAVVYPAQEAHIQTLLELARTYGFAVIPFGGGTSVVGGLEMPKEQASRPYISLDLSRLAALTSVDALSRLVTVQPGILGPALEAALQAQGLTLGHYPQSFEFSTVGGWVATRSAGQQSTRYGKIEALVASLRLVTPRGVLVTQPYPASALGPDLNQMAIGSEGILGVISEVTLKVSKLPERRDYRAMLFPDWASGQRALREVLQSDRHPATLRLSDAAETATLFKLREGKRSGGILRKILEWYLARMKNVRPEAACMLIMGFEGDTEQVEQDRDWTQGICERNGAVSLGAGVGESWYKGRFALPYLRDTLLDRGVLVDTLETSTSWANLEALYQAVGTALTTAIQADGLEALIFCHISHAYATGASLYFTLAARQIAGAEIPQWERYKRAATDAIVEKGGALSHHHSIGLDHAPWFKKIAGSEGARWLAALKATSDPDGLMNPGKILAEDDESGA